MRPFWRIVEKVLFVLKQELLKIYERIEDEASLHKCTMPIFYAFFFCTLIYIRLLLNLLFYNNHTF